MAPGSIKHVIAVHRRLSCYGAVRLMFTIAGCRVQVFQLIQEIAGHFGVKPKIVIRK